MLTGAGNFIRFYFRQRYYRLRAKGKYAAFGKNISGFQKKYFSGIHVKNVHSKMKTLKYFSAFYEALKKMISLCLFIHQRYSVIHFSLPLKCYDRIRCSSFTIHHFPLPLIHKLQKNVNKIVCYFFS
jgi:hypothetical protein